MPCIAMYSYSQTGRDIIDSHTLECIPDTSAINRVFSGTSMVLILSSFASFHFDENLKEPCKVLS